MFLFGSACLPCHHAPPPAARERSRRSLQLATELVFQVIQSELNERRDLRSWLFFCGAESTGSFLLKHYNPSREALCSEDRVRTGSHPRPQAHLEQSLSLRLQSCRNSSAPWDTGGYFLLRSLPLHPKSELPSNSHLLTAHFPGPQLGHHGPRHSFSRRAQVWMSHL